MDYGYQLLRHVVQQVFGNLWHAARLTITPFLIPFLIVVIGAPSLFFAQTAVTDVSEIQPPAGSVFFVMLLAFIFGVVAWLWAAVAWHRFVLREEYPSGLLPPWHGGNMASYLWRTFLIGLVLAGAGFAFSLVFLLFGSFPPFGPVSVVLGFGFVFGVSWIAMRLGLILPAAAIGEKVGLGESWEATRSVSGQILLPIVVIALVFTGLSQLILLVFGTVVPLPEGFPTDALGGYVPRVLTPVGQIVNLGLVWLQMLINLALLTTLYGNLVEGRQLN